MFFKKKIDQPVVIRELDGIVRRLGMVFPAAADTGPSVYAMILVGETEPVTFRVRQMRSLALTAPGDQVHLKLMSDSRARDLLVRFENRTLRLADSDSRYPVDA